jgi:beta-lactamase class A
MGGMAGAARGVRKVLMGTVVVVVAGGCGAPGGPDSGPDSRSAVAGDAAASLESRLEALLDALPANSSMYARHLPTGREVAVRADEPMNTLSTIKVQIMVQAFRDAEAGLLDLEERHPLQPGELRRGSGLLQGFDPGLAPTLRDLVAQMIITSDNTATDLVLDRVGLDRVNRTLEELGYRDTRVLASTGDLFRRLWEWVDPAHAALSPREVFERGFPSDPEAAERTFAFEGDPEEWLGRTTAREMSRFLEQIHEGELASRASSDEMMAILHRQFSSSRLPRRIGLQTRVAHKTGDWPPIAGNDVGIIDAPGGPIVVSVFVTQNRGDFREVEEAHGRIAEALLEAWGEG